MKRHIKKIAVILGILLVCFTLFHLYARNYVTLEMIKKHKEFLQSIVTYNYGIAVFLYMVIYLAAVLFMLPFISILSVLGGFLFGTFWATLFINGAATGGTVIVITFLRYFLKQRWLLSYKASLAHFNAMVLRHGVLYLLGVRVVFVIPFFVVNSLLALTTIPLKTIAWTTSLGIIPITLFFASAGSQLEQINHISDLISLKMIGFFGLLVGLLVIPLFLKKVKIL